MFASTGISALWLLSVFSSAVDGQIAGKCSGQTCYIASLAASTTEPYKLQGGKKPTGGNAIGDSCIKSAYKTLGLPAPAGLRLINLIRRSENIEEFYSKLESINPTVGMIFDGSDGSDASNALEKRQSRCTENTVLFGRGTTEPGTMGTTVGPALSTGLSGSSWSVHGISYSADLSGIYCLGMSGGLKCVQQINALATRCPKTNIVLSGYSQGAMVARICAAWAGEAAKKQIKGLALFGDPFNGADVKGIPASNVKTWCNSGDGVCKGQFQIGAAHLAYVGSSTSQAIAWIKNIVKTAKQ